MPSTNVAIMNNLCNLNIKTYFNSFSIPLFFLAYIVYFYSFIFYFLLYYVMPPTLFGFILYDIMYNALSIMKLKLTVSVDM